MLALHMVLASINKRLLYIFAVPPSSFIIAIKTYVSLTSQKEHRQHDDDHSERRQADVSQALEQKERRHSDERRPAEADQLSFGQIEEHFGFHPRKVTRDRDICGHIKPSFHLVGAEYALCQRTGLEQGETQKNGVTHNAPDGCDDVIRECYRLDKYSVYADTNDN